MRATDRGDEPHAVHPGKPAIDEDEVVGPREDAREARLRVDDMLDGIRLGEHLDRQGGHRRVILDVEETRSTVLVHSAHPTARGCG